MPIEFHIVVKKYIYIFNMFYCLDAQPTESEKEIYNQVNVVLKDAEGILEDLQSYRGAGHEIREVS